MLPPLSQTKYQSIKKTYWIITYLCWAPNGACYMLHLHLFHSGVQASLNFFSLGHPKPTKIRLSYLNSDLKMKWINKLIISVTEMKGRSLDWKLIITTSTTPHTLTNTTKTQNYSQTQCRVWYIMLLLVCWSSIRIGFWFMPIFSVLSCAGTCYD